MEIDMQQNDGWEMIYLRIAIIDDLPGDRARLSADVSHWAAAVSYTHLTLPTIGG